MRWKLSAVLAALLSFSLMLVSCGKAGETASFALDFSVREGSYPNEELVVEKDGLKLRVNQADLGITLEDVKTGVAWKSYLDAPDGTSDDSMKDYRTLLSLNYYTITTGTENTLYSWNDCVTRNQYTVEKKDNSIFVTLVLGKIEKIRILPYAVRKETLEAVLGKISSEREKRKIKSAYKLYDLNEAADEEQRQQWTADYPVLQKMPVYIMQSGVGERDKDELESYFVRAGFTHKEVEEENKALQIKAKESVYPAFLVPIELKIENGDFIVSVLSGKIAYDKELYVLNRIKVLPFFMNAQKGENGWLLLPDGSGALIELDSGKRRITSQITTRVYNNDLAVERMRSNVNVKLPIIGAGNNRQAMLGILEEGSSKAEITSEYNGTVSGAGYIYPTFIYKEYAESEKKSGGMNLADYEKTADLPAYKIRYRICPNGTDGYAALASSYREYLLNTGQLVKREELFGLQLETLGSLEPSKVLTSVSESVDMAIKLRKKDVKLNLRLNVFWKGGLQDYPASSLKFSNSVGSKNDLISAQKRLKDSGIDAMLDLNLQTVGKDRWGDGYSVNRDSVRTLNNYFASYARSNGATGEAYYPAIRYLVDPRKMIEMGEKAAAKLKKVWNGGISLGKTGELLYSNQKENNSFSREQALEAEQNMLHKLSDQFALSVDGGNAYVFPYVSHIYNVDYQSSNHRDYDRTVPFYQMVLHGYIGYSTSALNMVDDIDEAVLNAVETGAMPHFTLIKENGVYLKNSPYAEYISVDGAYWLEKAAEIYQTVQTAVGDLNGQAITYHGQIKKGVAVTKYANGIQIFVNHTEETVVIDGITIPAKQYVRVNQ